MSIQVKESYFWQQVKAGLSVGNTHLSRIENTAGTGISDVSACANGVEVWLELKVFHGSRLHFRQSQRLWILKRATAGGRTFILARNNDVMLLYDALPVVLTKARPDADGKSFSVLEADLPTPKYECKKPFNWAQLHERVFKAT